uniref:Uncharacterized protein n=1 Tax=viral metagenome TaxID=1070528 RepID=A0A6C0ERC4_9ZZZZ
MTLSKKQYIIIFLAFISCILYISLFKWLDYLIKKDYVVEYFQQYKGITDTGSPTTSHTVNLPLTTNYSCKNFCGPTSRCSITGQQCTSDIDCPGCQPYVPPLQASDNCIPGENDAGKLTLGVTPKYSTLTTDIGTQAAFFEKSGSNKTTPAPQANFGVNVWKNSFDEENNMFSKRYTPSNLQFMPNYPKRNSTTGEFIEDGPLASNAYLS